MQITISTIKAIIAKLKRQPELVNELSDHADLINEVGLDSLELLQFMLEVEERLGIQIDFDALEFSYLHAIHTLAVFLEKMPLRINSINQA
jgi:acyl carrier protein